jgi:hypothetical protein
VEADGACVVEVHDGNDHPASLEMAGADAGLIAAAPALAAEVLRLRGLIAERCAAIETGPTRRRIPGCQTDGPCYVCDYLDREHAVGE